MFFFSVIGAIQMRYDDDDDDIFFYYKHNQNYLHKIDVSISAFIVRRRWYSVLSVLDFMNDDGSYQLSHAYDRFLDTHLPDVSRLKNRKN